MQILQITDPHLFGNAGGTLRGVETDSSLRRVLEHAFSGDEEYAAILATGDLVQDDTSGYLRFKSILNGLRVPVLCLPGNHDEPAAMRRSLSSAPFRYCGSHVIGAWNFVMLDSCEPGQVGGRLRERELQRLDASLSASPAHALVCLHHHPVDLGSRWLDAIGLGGAADFWRVIDAHPHVRGVAWGHVHQAYEGNRGKLRLFGTPSTCAQFVPQSEHYGLDKRPPAYRRFDLRDDGRIESAVHWVQRIPMHRAAAQ